MVYRFKSRLSYKSLNDRCHQIEKALGTCAIVAGTAMSDIGKLGCEIRHHPTTFQKRLLCKQHASHVRMDEDWIGGLIWGFGARCRTHLQAFRRILKGCLITQFHQTNALGTHKDARLIHHRKHAPHAVVGLAYQIATTVFKVQHAGGVPMDAHLVLDRTTNDAV